jgi:hypothetical protein
VGCERTRSTTWPSPVGVLSGIIGTLPFPRSVVYEACNFLGAALGYHGEFEDLVLRWELDQFDSRTGAIHQRCRELFRFLRDNPGASYDGRLISDLVVEEAARHISQHRESPGFVRALERAGYVVEDGQLRRTLPEALDLPAADDEVHALLNRYNLATPIGHLDQAIDSHARGNWAAANGQVRSFLESLLDEVAYLTVPGAPRGANQGEARREALASSQPPFLSVDLNEWGNQGKNLVNGVFKRLHPQGAHPGLSDEEDSTFRLHLVLLLGRLFLRRLDGTLQQPSEWPLHVSLRLAIVRERLGSKRRPSFVGSGERPTTKSS